MSMEDTQTQNTEQQTKEEIIIEPQTLLRLGILGGLLVATIFLFSGELSQSQNPAAAASAGATQEEAIDPFEHLSLEASAVYVYDIAQGETLYTKNESAQLPLASLTKVMTALVSSEHISPEATITISKEAIKVDGDNGLKAEERWTFKDLLDYTLVVSSNDGAHAIAGTAGAGVLTGDKSNDSHTAFTKAMNKRARDLSLTQTYFINESGLDTSSEVSGGYGSARDMAKLLAYTVVTKPHLLEATTYEALKFISEDGFIYNATNTNRAIGAIPNILASKTGFTDLAGGNLMVAFDAGINHPVVAVVLGSSFDGRFSDIEQLVRASLTKIAN